MGFVIVFSLSMIGSSLVDIVGSRCTQSRLSIFRSAMCHYLKGPGDQSPEAVISIPSKMQLILTNALAS
jgi:hypothetical protein